MSEDLFQGLILAAVGMGVVFVALALVGGLMSLLSRPLPSVRRTRQAESKGPSASIAVPETSPDAATLVVIAAAVAVLVGPSARIRRVQFVSQDLPSAWAAHGRVAIQASHRLRKTPR